MPRFLHWLFHSWQTVRDTRITVYQQCRFCGRRRAWQRLVGGCQPIDREWVQSGRWMQPAPPRCVDEPQ